MGEPDGTRTPDGPTASQNDGLTAAYARCRDLHRRHGRSYYLATRLLPSWKRRHVHALYGFTRTTDDIVDVLDGTPLAERSARLAAWAAAFRSTLRGAPADPPGSADRAVLAAVVHTIAVWRLDHADFESFLDSMAMDLTVTRYAGYPDLLRYMEGSAAVIGTMLLPILDPRDRLAAREPARQLGLAFQLTNFIRDVREDLRRGRVYLPEEDMDLFGVTRAGLWHAAAGGTATAGITGLIRYEVDRAREHYVAARPGIAELGGASRACVATAYRVYGAILDQVAGQGFDALCRRAVVPTRRRLVLAAAAVLHRRALPPVPGDRPAVPSGRPVGPVGTVEPVEPVEPVAQSESGSEQESRPGPGSGPGAGPGPGSGAGPRAGAGAGAGPRAGAGPGAGPSVSSRGRPGCPRKQPDRDCAADAGCAHS